MWVYTECNQGRNLFSQLRILLQILQIPLRYQNLTSSLIQNKLAILKSISKFTFALLLGFEITQWYRIVDFPRQNNIMIHGKHEESQDGIIKITEISFECRQFKNLRLCLQSVFKNNFGKIVCETIFENYSMIFCRTKVFLGT